MSEIIAIRSKNRTPKAYLDLSRPLTMVDADNVFKKLSTLHGNSAKDTLKIVAGISKVLGESRGADIETIWARLEKELYKNKTLSTKAKTDNDKLQTVFGLLYSAVENIDMTATSTVDMLEFRALYYEIRNSVEARLVPSQTGKDLRMLNRIIDTTTTRMDAVSSRFNERVAAKELAGPKL